MKAIILFIFFMVLSSCDLNRFSQYSIVSPDDIKDISADDFFYVNIDSAFAEDASSDPLQFLIYAMDDGPDTDCKISVNNESATEDLFCILDIMEGDLWLHKINLKYNVPPGMCSYLAFLPHWHYNKSAGLGPREIYACDIQTTTTAEDGKETHTYKEYFQTSNIREPVNNDSKYKGKGLCKDSNDDDDDDDDNDKKYKENPTDLCGYECCWGRYKVKGSKSHNEDKDQDWDGVQDCIGGLAKLSKPEGFDGDLFNKDGFPYTLIKESGSKRVDGSYTLPPLIKSIDRSISKSGRVSFPTANFFKAIEDDKETDNIPSFYKPPPPKPDHPANLEEGHPFITWSCLDNAKETKHRIHLLIREWNTQEEFKDFKENGRGDPDTNGSEGDDCEYYKSDHNTFSPCNDLDDADDNYKKPYPEIEYESGSGGGSSDK